MSEAFMKTIEVLEKEGHNSLTELPDKIWIKKLDDNWTFAIHANKDEKREIEPEGCMKCDAKAGELIVWWNGWIAGILTPFNGVLAAGELANENTFIEALDRAILSS